MVVGVATGEGAVPAALPHILKNYTKSAIRTQPRDLLRWSHAYFRALNNGEVPPVKDRLEFPIPETQSGLTPGVLRVLHRQMNGENSLDFETLQEKGGAMGIDEEVMKEAWNSATEGGSVGSVAWDILLSFLAHDSNQSMAQTLQTIMAVVTEDSVTQKVPASTLLDHYSRIHTIDDQHKQACEYLNDVADYQGGFLVPSDLTRPSCPSLD